MFYAVDRSLFLIGGLRYGSNRVYFTAPRGNSVAEPCYRIRIAEKVERYVPVKPDTAYPLLSEDAVRRGEIPEVFD